MLLKLKHSKKGFTLIELIVVIAILAILAAVAVPSFIGLKNKAADAVVIANASAMASAINNYNAMYDTSKIAASDLTGTTPTAIGKLSGAQMLPAFDKVGDDVIALGKVSFNAAGIAIVGSPSATPAP